MGTVVLYGIVYEGVPVGGIAFPFSPKVHAIARIAEEVVVFKKYVSILVPGAKPKTAIVMELISGYFALINTPADK